GTAASAEQRVSPQFGALGGGNPRQQGMPGIGRSHPAWLLDAVQRECIGRQLVTPERGLKPLAQRVRLLPEGSGGYRMVERRGESRGVPLGAVNVGLNLAQGDRALGKATILVKD